jgi:phosphoribosylformylglycinamidine synthase PurS subunit
MKTKKQKFKASIFKEEELFHARIIVTLRRSILDPQGKAIEHGIHSLGHEEVSDVRIGKIIELDVDTTSKEKADAIVNEVGRKLLANPVMEDFTFTLSEFKGIQ